MANDRNGTRMDYDRSNCPVAVSLDILGDKWTLLVVRDLWLGARRYSDFEISPERYPTNILADRLKRLVEHGLVEKTAYSERPQRFQYALTKKGKDALPILQAMRRWANHHYDDTARTPGKAVSTRTD